MLSLGDQSGKLFDLFALPCNIRRAASILVHDDRGDPLCNQIWRASALGITGSESFAVFCSVRMTMQIDETGDDGFSCYVNVTVSRRA